MCRIDADARVAARLAGIIQRVLKPGLLNNMGNQRRSFSSADKWHLIALLQPWMCRRIVQRLLLFCTEGLPWLFLGCRWPAR